MSDLAPTVATRDWWTGFFDDTYAAIGLAPRHGQPAEDLADGIVRLLRLERGQRVFDQCCGVGRIALPLARRGLEVEGVELSGAYVASARRLAEAEGLPAHFTCADAYEFVASPACDAAINVFTSFGYSDDDARNERMVRRAFESLRPGGVLLLERFNPCWVVAFGLMNGGSRIATPGGDVVTLEEPVADWLRGVITTRWTIVLPDGTRDVRQFETRLLFPNELASMAVRAGFVGIEILSGTDGQPFDRHARRLVMTARRP